MAAQPDEGIDVARGALLVAQEEYPQLEVDNYLARLDQLAKAAAAGMRSRMSAGEQVAALNHFLFVEQGFVGNNENYYDPRNSYLNEVLERRTGIPLTLSIVYLEVGKRLGEDVIATFKWRHAAWVKELHIKTLTNTRAKEITAEGVLVADNDGHEVLLPADTVILAIPRKSRQQLINDLEFVSDELYAIGDAIKPRSMHNAIRDGYLIGMRI